jgi:hypothetical protein
MNLVSKPDFRTMEQRVSDLEHDNNMMRGMIAELTAEQVRAAEMIEKCANILQKIISKGMFVGKVQ